MSRAPERRSHRVRPRGMYGMPLAVTLVVLAGAVSLWWSLDTWQHEQVLRTISTEAVLVRNEIVARIESRILALVRMADRWQTVAQDRVEWERDGLQLVRHYPGVQAIAWVDPTFHARWVVPLSGNEVLDGAPLQHDPQRRAALQKARELDAPRMVRTFDLLEGHRGVLAVAPILHRENLHGFIAAVFRTQEMIDHMLRNVSPGYGVSISDDHDELYYRPGVPRAPRREWGAGARARFEGVTWDVQVWPAPSELTAMRSPLASAVLAGGAFVAILLGLAVHLAQRAAYQAARAEAVNRSLQLEIAERRRAEATVEHLAAIVDSSDAAIIGLDFDARVVSWNTGAERIYGRNAEQMRGRSMAEVVPEGGADDLGNLVARVHERGVGGELETEHETAQGRRVFVAITVSPIRNGSGRLTGASAVIRDVSRRKRAELELEQTLQRLQRSSEDQSVSLAATSHDVRGALTTIAGYSEFLADEVGGEEHRHMALRIMSLAHTLSDIMTDLLEYAREQSGTSVSQQDVALRTFLAPLIEDTAHAAREKGLAFRARLPDEGAVRTDPVKLTRILQNLLSNAVRYTTEGSVEVDVDLAPSEIRIRVCDSGIGIPAEDLQRVFDEFYRTEQAKRVEKLGTGLGLATVRRLARLLGGDVHVESAVGVGSTFEVTIPCDSTAAAA